MKKVWHILAAVLLTSAIQGPIPRSYAQLANTSFSNGPADPAGSCSGGSLYVNSTTGHLWTCSAGAWTDSNAGNVPSGSILMVGAGTCPGGYTENAGLNGAMPYGTVAANGDVGTTGGSNAVTPTGTNSTAAFTPAGSVGAPTFSGTPGTVPAQVVSWPVGVPTFTGSLGTVPAETFTGTPFTSVINHTHTITATLSVQGGTTAATTGTHVMTSTATGGSVRAVTSGDAIAASSGNPSGGVSSITPAGSNGTASFTPAGLIGWPAGVPANSTAEFTPAGSNSAPAFTGTPGTVPKQTWTGASFDNRPAFVKVIFCVKA